MTKSGWYVLRSPAGRLSVLWCFAGHTLAVAGPFEDYGEAQRELARRKDEG